MKLLDTPCLQALLLAARKANFNRQGPTGLDLDPDGRHIIGDGPFLQNEGDCVRCLMYVKLTGRESPAEFQLDIALATYNAIPEYNPEPENQK